VRAAKAMQYLCHGYEQSVEEIVNGALFASDNDEMVIVADIELYSLCEHHLLPFIGKAHVAYIPTGKVLGLSKIARLVDMFARRLQIQENLTRQIADAVQQVTGRWRRGGHRSPAHVHDDARRRETEFDHEHLGDARRLPRVEQHPPGVPAIDWTEQVVMPQLQPGMARIRVKDLRLRTFIGINEDEILNKQDVLINLTILYAAQEAVRDNDIDHALNYRTITKAIIAHVEGNRFALLERLTQELLDLVMSNAVLYAEVEVDKPHALRFAESVSITLWRPAAA
jgi:D-erythro-7,8-dihydroneopterin triphosphate epimerase